MSAELDLNFFPLAYLITFRTYGTWLHGDGRGSVDRKHNVYGTARIAPDRFREHSANSQLKHQPVRLDIWQRKIVEIAAREVCREREYGLLAVNARSNHVHAVVSAHSKPEPILADLKTYATRKLRHCRLIPVDVKPWARHGSTRYLWKENHVERAVHYVLFGQGDDVMDFQL